MRIFRAILLIIALALLIVSVRQFMRGYRDWEQAQIVEKGYQAEIRELEAERDRRKQRVELLKDDTLTKERLVRKRFGYVKPGEVKYKIIKPTQSE
ncbi:septum formation initiator family protein [Candidatus Poribacteria bacterium]|nr:septum formation initiator family protein [Candidatus Poribacteria bacterium]